MLSFEAEANLLPTNESSTTVADNEVLEQDMVCLHGPIAVLAIPQQNSNLYSNPYVPLFTGRIQSSWAMIALLAFAPELLRSAHIVPHFLLLDYLWKASVFLALGFLAPLAFRSFNAIVWGFLLSLSAAPLTVVLQSVLSHGQVFQWYELAGKLAVVSLGFAFALEFRYKLRISLGVFKLDLSNDAS